MIADWPKAPTMWTEGRTLFVSIPFTWNLRTVRVYLRRPNLLWDTAIVGGPAVKLMPGFFARLPHVTEGDDMPGVLQRVNPMATRTTTGCPNACGFCGVKRIEPGRFAELSDWPDQPILTDNNLFAASVEHFDRVMDRIEGHGWCDFNQGVDARRLTQHHAERIGRIKKPLVRLALDGMAYSGEWEAALGRLLRAGVALKNIRSYALVGYKSDPAEAWCRCQWIESFGVKALPMWFHPLDAMRFNAVTEDQRGLDWNEQERTHLMGYFYKHRGQVRVAA